MVCLWVSSLWYKSQLNRCKLRQLRHVRYSYLSRSFLSIHLSVVIGYLGFRWYTWILLFYTRWRSVSVGIGVASTERSEAFTLNVQLIWHLFLLMHLTQYSFIDAADTLKTLWITVDLILKKHCIYVVLKLSQINIIVAGPNRCRATPLWIISRQHNVFVVWFYVASRQYSGLYVIV